MKHCCPSACFIAVARLKDHRLAVTRQSRRRKCDTADILQEEGSEVWGIVYKSASLRFAFSTTLKTAIRRKIFVEPVGDGNELLKVLVYVVNKESNPPLPNPEYKRLILEGARHWKLPEAYIEILERLELQVSDDQGCLP